MYPKDAEGIANCVDPDQTLIWVCTVCPDLSVGKLRKITVIVFYDFKYWDSEKNDYFIVSQYILKNSSCMNYLF